MEIIVSVVSGTYNRLGYLQKMIESVRSSVSYGIPYEIILVDGGSTDGTIEWCNKQNDITLIKHGKLLGAVKAFNDGAKAARGRYVIMANDDIEFIGLTITNAISFMEDNPSIGIGCFYQDRRGWDWHVEQMPAVKNGKQISAFYGQVCIVRRVLGDKVGWWGNYLHTYGGDNELSCNILELGYDIQPAPCTKIHDYTPPDLLRSSNNMVQKVDGQHPDTAAWLKKWTRKGKVGPIIPQDPIVEKFTTQLRVMYMPIYEPGHVIQKTTKRGLRDALAKRAITVEYDYLADELHHVMEISCAIDPHLFIMQLQDSDMKYHVMLDELRRQHPRAKFVNWNGDYHPETLFSNNYISLLKNFDITGLVTTSVGSVYNNAGVNWFYWQIGYEEEIGVISIKNTPRHDVVFLANGYSKERLALAKQLRELKGVDVGLYGSWPENIRANGSTLYDFNAGARLYKVSKIAIGDSQWPQATGFVSNRMFQSLAAGAFLLHQYFDGMEELLGLKDGEHLVVWSSVDDLCAKIDYYLAHPDERKRISDAGKDYVMKHHSFDARVSELFGKLYA